MRFTIIVICFLFSINPIDLSAQEENAINIYGNIGIGLSSMNFGLNGGVNLRINDIIVTGRLSGAAEGIFGSGLEEGAVLVGYLFKWENTHITLSGGLGSVKYNKTKGLFSPIDISKSLGLAFESQICYSFFSFLGIGVSIYGNANGAKSFIGLNLNLFAGGLRF